MLDIDFEALRNGDRIEVADGVRIAVFIGNAGYKVQVEVQTEETDLFPVVWGESLVIGTGDRAGDLGYAIELAWEDYNKTLKAI